MKRRRSKTAEEVMTWNKRLGKLLLLTSLLPLASWAQELTACYKVYFTFFPVAQTCITYSIKDKFAYVESSVKTINVGKLVKRVYNIGSARMVLNHTLEPNFFKYHQEEGNFKRFQEYRFEKGKIYVRRVRYVDLTDEVKEVSEGVYEYKNSPEPYTASLLLYKATRSTDSGYVNMFYDDDYYKIPYKVVSRFETLEMGERIFRTRLVEVQPNVKTQGLLRPKGSWRLWIDEKTQLPVRMQLSFVIGSVRAELYKMEGDMRILRKILGLEPL